MKFENRPNIIVYLFANIAIIWYKFFTSIIFSWLSPNWRWNRYAESMLRTFEKKILKIVRTAYRGWYVDIGPVVGPADKLWTISLNNESPNTPLVMLHGLGAGVALWCLNLDALAVNRPVYAFDLLGFGRSSRPDFSSDALEAEQQMVRAIEEWRREMNLERFVLLGHSMGGFLAASYALTYPDRVKHLILADPWGFPEKLPDHQRREIPLLIRAVAYTLQPFNPLSGIRVAGPFGPWVINKLRPDISKKFAGSVEDESLISQYIYQCNAQYPSGESAFHAMMSGFGWAKNPMVNRIHKLPKTVPITLLYGSKSWVDNSAGEIIREKRMDSYFKLQVISGAGHHVYADKPNTFNQYVIEACNQADMLPNKFLSIMPSNSSTSSVTDEETNTSKKPPEEPIPDNL